MKITTEETEDAYQGAGYGSSSLDIAIKTNEGEKSVYFGGGEPEDFCLARDLNSAYKIKDMLVLAYNAGKNGEELEIEELEPEE